MMRISALLIAAAFAAGPAPQRLETVRVRTTAFPVMAPLYIAEAEGFFAKEGLQLEHVEMLSSSPVVPALIRGDIDILPTIVTPGIYNAMIRGGRMRIVASQQQFVPGCAHSGFLVTKAFAASGVLDSGSRLRGHSYSIGNKNLISIRMMEQILKPLGLTPDDLKSVDIPEAVVVESLRTGRVDLALNGEPYLSQAIASGNYILWRAANGVLPNFQYSVFVYGPQMLDARPEVGKRFMAAYLRGVRQFLGGKTPRNLDLLVKPLGTERDVLTRTCWAPMTVDGRVNVASLLDHQRWLLGKGAIDREVTAAEMLDNRFIDYANNRETVR